jgi:hypothetical protein
MALTKFKTFIDQNPELIPAVSQEVQINASEAIYKLGLSNRLKSERIRLTKNSIILRSPQKMDTFDKEGIV